jgi:DNA-binding transcriptional LysR family regulator
MRLKGCHREEPAKLFVIASWQAWQSRGARPAPPWPRPFRPCSAPAACRLAGITPNILMESRAPHALLALAEAGHGVAIVPSALRTKHYRLRIVRVMYQGKPVSEPLTVLSDRRRPLPPFAIAFREMLSEHCRNVFPITGPTEGKRDRAPELATRSSA